MKDTSLIEILKTFNKEEIKSFKKFIISPYVRSRRNIGLLFDHVIQYNPEFKSSDLNRKGSFEILFPGEKYSEKKIMNYVNDLAEACKDFLIHNMLMKDEVQSQIYALKAFFEKNLFKQFAKVLNKSEDKLKQGFSAEKNYFASNAMIQEWNNSYYLLNNDHKKLRENWDEYFEMAALRFLVDYTWMRCSNITSVNTFYKKNTDKNIDAVTECFLPDKMLELAEKFTEKYPEIAILHSMLLRTVRDPGNSVNYNILKGFFLRNINKYDREEKFRIICHMINLCGENISYYGDEFTKEMLDLYKIMLKNNAYSLSENEYLMNNDYRNIQSIALIFGDSEFLEKMIKEYSLLLNPEFREDNVNLSRAYLYFLRNKFDMSLLMLSKISSENILFKIDIKKLMLILLYELGYYEQAFAVIDTFRHYISNSKEITEPRKISSMDFLDAYSILLKITTGKGEKKISLLEKKAGKLNIFLKNWFLDKISKMKQ